MAEPDGAEALAGVGGVFIVGNGDSIGLTEPDGAEAFAGVGGFVDDDK